MIFAATEQILAWGWGELGGVWGELERIGVGWGAFGTTSVPASEPLIFQQNVSIYILQPKLMYQGPIRQNWPYKFKLQMSIYSLMYGTKKKTAGRPKYMSKYKDKALYRDNNPMKPVLIHFIIYQPES